RPTGRVAARTNGAQRGNCPASTELSHLDGSGGVPMRHHQSRLGWTIAIAVGALLLVACAAPAPAGSSGAVPPASQPASVAAPAAPSTSGSESAGSATVPAAQAEWERTLAAARQEGVVAVGVQPGQLFRDWFAQFENAYPGIKLEITGTDLAQF